MKDIVSFELSSGKKTIEERACSLARYIIDSKDTVRGAAKKFRDKQINSTHGCNTPERFKIRTSNS